MANTVIQLKYSNITNKPPLLNVAEPAYSSVSGTLWIDDGTGVVPIGGKAYTDKIDSANSAATANVLVQRDTTGNASFNYVLADVVGSLYGNAQTATKLQTTRYFNLSGDIDSVSYEFDGTANVEATLELTNTGVTSGTYGGVTSIPVFTVDDDGRVSYAANVSVGTSLSFEGDSGTANLDLLSDTLVIKGGDGITSVAIDSNNTVILDVDSTVIKSDRASQTIEGDIAITGNLVISGNTITQDVETITTQDSLIKLAANNIADAIDIGFYGQYNDGTTKFAGLVRDASDGVFKLFVDETTDPTDNVVSYGVENRATIDANFTGGNVSSLFSDIAVGDGGTGRGSFTIGSIVIGNGTGQLEELANTTTAGSYGSNSHHAVITVDDYGRISAVTNTAINIDTSAVVSGILPIARGGSNNDTYTTGAAIFFDGTKIATLANTGVASTYGSASDIPVITTDDFGRVSSVSNTAIAIDTSAIVSGTLGIMRGGTGASSFSIKGVIVSDPSSTTGALSSLTSGTEGHVLQINSSGAPTFAHLNGGTF